MVTEQDIKDYCKSRGYDYDFTKILDDEDRAELIDEVEGFKRGDTIFDGILGSLETTLKYMNKG